MQKKRFSWNNRWFGCDIRTQINIDPSALSLLAPKIMPLLHGVDNSDFIVRIILVQFVIVTKCDRF